MTPTLSVLDTSPIVAGSTAVQALAHSLDLAQACEQIGYHRYWVAEHHGMRGVASAVPSITISAAASRTSTIRVGAGGVMLPNHPPLHVAEQFGMLDALFPERVDLALGRGLGGTATTVAALRPEHERTATPYDAQLDELEAHFRPGEPGGLRAIPAENQRPTIWLLGSGIASAELAARRGLPYAFAHHLRPENTYQALTRYRDQFTPSRHHPEPRCLISVSVIAGENGEHAEWLAGSTRLKVLSRSHGTPIQLPSPRDAAAFDYTAEDRAFIDQASQSVLAGDPNDLGARLRDLAASTGVHELVVTSPIHHHRDRVRSYELLQEALGH